MCHVWLAHVLIGGLFLCFSDDKASEEKSLSQLAAALRDKDKAVRIRAAKAITEMGPKAEPLTSQLIRALEDDEEEVRQAVARALGRIGSKVVPALLQAFKDNKKPEPRVGVLDALSLMGPDARAALPALQEALRDNSGLLRVQIARTLMEIDTGNKPAVQALVQALLGGDQAAIREQAAWELGKQGPRAKDAVPGLTKALEDDDPAVRATTAWALGQMGGSAKDALPALRRASRDSVAFVREEATEAIKNIVQDK